MDGSISRYAASVLAATSMTVAVASEANWSGPFLRSQVDAARGRIWVLTPAGVALYDVSTWQPIAKIALPEWIWANWEYVCPPTLAVGPDGEAVISSNVVPTLWRVDPVTLNASKHDLAVENDAGMDIGITALAYSAQHGAYFAVSPALGSLWRIDPSLRNARRVSQVGNAHNPKACK